MLTSIETALVVDDDTLMREFIVETLKRDGIAVTQAGNGLEAKRLLEENDFDLAFIDLKMPGLDGIQLLRFMKETGVSALGVIVTAFGTVEQAVDAMKIGAYDFLMKPFSPEQVELIVKRAREWIGLKAQNAYLQEELGWTLPRGRQILGRSPVMNKLMANIEQIAGSSSTTLISGESGTGKELVALAIHSLGERLDKPFVRMNCAAVPDTLLDSELFGHEKGAFTSAVSRRLGRFELANGGSLLLDEISEMKIGLQAKLLRVLQEHEFERVGGTRTIKCDCRVIATTNKKLEQRVARGEFRQDLYYRLNVLPIRVPPLRERDGDIPLLANAFLERYQLRKNGQAAPLAFTNEAIKLMTAYSWPGNVRELENLVERLSVLEPGPQLAAQALPPEIRRLATCPPSQIVRPEAATAQTPHEDTQHTTLNLATIERETIIQALGITGGNRQKTAGRLGISVRTLRNKINTYRREGTLEL